MIPEILLIKGLWEHNRKLWYFSFPFHAGLYLLFALIGLLALGAIVQANGVTVAPDGNILVSALYYLTILVGFSSLAAGLFGSIALLLNRYNDKKLKNYSAPMDFANLYFFIVAFAVGFLSWLLVDHDFAIGRTIAQGVITFEDLAINSVWVSGAVFLWAILLAYIPLTHMSHFFTKYFIYHHVRWEDEPNLRGSKVEAEINKNLNYPVSWSAPHINGDGKKTWVDVALAEGTEDEK